MTVPAVTVTRTGRLRAEQVQQVHSLVEQATGVDEVAPLSEHVLLHLPTGGDEAGRNLLLYEADDLVAYGHLDVTDEVEGASAEVVVAPSARGRGHGRRAVQELLQNAPGGRLRLWAHGDTPAAAATAAALGFRRSRVLLQMRRHLGPSAAPLPPVSLPAGVHLRSFVVGQDEQAWTTVNNRAFADHPDQGGWAVAEVRLREGEPWFDPGGFFLAERDGALVGFHWTKVHGGHRDHAHPDGTHHADHAGHAGDAGDAEPADPAHEHPAHAHPAHEHHDHPPIGEVYIVGVDPAEQGHGLGPALTLTGLHHLQERGLSEVLLYVDESNAAAVRVYERLGFTRHAVDVMYARP